MIWLSPKGLGKGILWTNGIKGSVSYILLLVALAGMKNIVCNIGYSLSRGSLHVYRGFTVVPKLIENN